MSQRKCIWYGCRLFQPSLGSFHEVLIRLALEGFNVAVDLRLYDLVLFISNVVM
jgi:hypothetical protein